jgi:hypothetical protein
MPKPKKVVPKVLEWTLSLKMGNEVVESSGETMEEALANLNRPTKIFLKGIFTVVHGDKKREKKLQPVQIKRLFYKVARKYQAKTHSFGL